MVPTNAEVGLPVPARRVAWEQYNAARTCTTIVYLKKKRSLMLREQRPYIEWIEDPKNGCQGYFFFNYIGGRQCIQCQCPATAVLLRMKWG